MTHRTLLPTKPKALRRIAPAVALLALLLLLGAAIPNGLASGSAPLFQQGSKLTGGEETGEGRFGRTVAVSADGDTALVGGPRDSSEAGAVWVFTRSGSTWTQQAKLIGGEESGAGHFGRGVALSADGNTALIGAPNDESGGAAWVFTRSGSTWTQQAKLTGAGESGSGWFGQSVALSANGDTALIGGYVDHSDTGAAWVFERSEAGAGATWEQQGEKLTGGGEESGEGEFGWSVALSAEGDTALIGGRKDGGGAGAAWVFARTGPGAGASWARQGEKLTGGGEESGEGEFGQSVALSAEGDTALIGGYHDDSGAGAAWVFARTGSGAGASWAQQGTKLTGAGEVGRGYFGDAVALTPDGDTALIGGVRDDEQRGAAWLFARAGSAASATWTQQGEKLTGGSEESGKGEFGWSVGLSADGDTAFAGGIRDSNWAGAVWVFGNEPPASQPPSSGSPSGGNPTPDAQTQSSGDGSSGAAATPKQGVAAYRVAGGGVVLLAKRLPTTGGRVRVKLRCTAATTCRGRLTLTLAPQARAARRSHAVTLAGGSFSILRGRAATVVLRLDRAGRSRVRAGRGYLHASLAIRVVAPDPPLTHAYAVKLVPRAAGR
jgi:FG-GAP repeat protein